MKTVFIGNLDCGTTTNPIRAGSGVIADQSVLLAPSTGRSPMGSLIQYLGFTHAANVRTYKFKQIVRGEKAREFTIGVDVALFAKHHIAFQEGPGLALRRLLSDEADASGAPASQSLTDADMLADLASRRDRCATTTSRSRPALRTSAAGV